MFNKFLAILFLSLWSFSVMASSVNINKADAETISKTLAGIGQSKAEAIVEYREQHGEFKSVQDLAKVKGIGLKTIERNQDKIVLKDS